MASAGAGAGAPLTVVRVRLPNRTSRVNVAPGGTVAQLRSAVAKELGGVPLGDIALSMTPGGDTLLPDAPRLGADLGFANGTMVYAVLKGAAATSAAAAAASAGGASAPAPIVIGKGGVIAAAPTPTPTPGGAGTPGGPPRQLTSRCQHAKGGACQHCCPPSEADYAAKGSEPLNKAGRYSSRFAGSAGGAAAEELSGDMEWLCRHRPDQMCVNCAPLAKGDAVHLEMLCLHGPDARCVNCLPASSTVSDRKFVTYPEYLEAKRARCEHSFNAVCVNCTPPSEVSYKLKAGCGRHAAWPRGICLDCAPLSVDLKLQEYRHVDFVQVNNFDEMQGLIRLWDGNRGAGLQRAGLLIGRYAGDANFRHGTKAVVEAIYEPPQVCDAATGVVRLLSDPREKSLLAVVGALGLTVVGWLFTRRAGSGPADPPLLPHELYAMAAMQLKYAKADAAAGGAAAAAVSAGLPTPPPGGSRFVTVVVSRKEDGISPDAFMASDTLMALVRDNVLTPPAPADRVFKMRKAGPGEPPVSEAIRKDKIRGAWKSSEFEPEFMTVTLGVGAASAAAPAAPGAPPAPVIKPVFRHASFPVENRAEFGSSQTPSEMKRHLQRYGSEALGHRLADFHALLYLDTLYDVYTAVEAARAVARGDGAVPEGVQLLLESVMAV